MAKKRKSKEVTFRDYDSANYLKTREDMVEYLVACFEEAPDDPGFLAEAIGTVARAHGMSKLAKEAGISREELYKALAENANPSFGTILKVFQALGMKLRPAMA